MTQGQDLNAFFWDQQSRCRLSEVTPIAGPDPLSTSRRAGLAINSGIGNIHRRHIILIRGHKAFAVVRSIGLIPLDRWCWEPFNAGGSNKTPPSQTGERDEELTEMMTQSNESLKRKVLSS